MASPLGGRPPHALVLCFPEQSHITQFTLLSSKLASHGFTVTFVLSLHTLASQPPPPQHLPLLRFVGVPDGLPPDCNRGSFESAYTATMNMHHGVHALMNDLLHHPADGAPPISLIIADVFVVWSQDLATRFDLPRVVFFTSNAVACSVCYHILDLEARGILPFRDENGTFTVKDPVTCIPGIFPLCPLDFPEFVTLQASHHLYRLAKRTSENIRTASSILINTVADLESNAIAALRKEIPTYTVGPLPLLCEEIPGAAFSVHYWQEHGDCLQWLDKREESSVLYVSFGSVSVLQVSDIEELALGLEASEQSFLWVLRLDSASISLSDCLPPGFLSRTKTQGLIISWAPQSAVLGHRAVGGFLSHCGWSSVMECMSSRGLPFVCWPQRGEQRLNSRILVDQWKIGVELRKQKLEGKVERKQIESAVRAVMQGQEGVEMRRRATELCAASRNAVGDGGSSKESLKAFLNVFPGI